MIKELILVLFVELIIVVYFTECWKLKHNWYKEDLKQKVKE